jgi:hypothetical protein
MHLTPVLGALALSALILGGCYGLHKSGKITTVHAESLHIFGLQLPGSAQDKAVSMVPKGAELVTGASAPEDLDSFFGILNRIWGIGYSTFTFKDK